MSPPSPFLSSSPLGSRANDVMLATVERNGVVECVHHGAFVVVDPTGETVNAGGDVDGFVFGRSANKMMQAVAMLRAGLQVDQRQLALTTASHSGGPEHLEVVRSILADAGQNVSALGNVSSTPLGAHELVAFHRGNEEASPLHMNCSGKHASMVSTCNVRGWDLRTYLHADHPLQQSITDTISELTKDAGGVGGAGVDGCGAPAHLVTLRGLARSLGSMATAHCDSNEGRVAHAIKEYPVLVGGHGRDVTEFLLHAPGWIGKDGADGIMVLASPAGHSVAVKIADGTERPRIPVAVAALRAAGVQVPDLPPAITAPEVRGGNSIVGSVRAAI